MLQWKLLQYVTESLLSLTLRIMETRLQLMEQLARMLEIQQKNYVSMRCASVYLKDESKFTDRLHLSQQRNLICLLHLPRLQDECLPVRPCLNTFGDTRSSVMDGQWMSI